MRLSRSAQRGAISCNMLTDTESRGLGVFFSLYSFFASALLRIVFSNCTGMMSKNESLRYESSDKA